MVQLYSSTDTAWKDSHFILSERSDFLTVNNLSIAIHALTICMLTLLFVDEIFLLRYMNWATIFSPLPQENMTQGQFLSGVKLV